MTSAYMTRDGTEKLTYACVSVVTAGGMGKTGRACDIVYICKGQFLGKLGLDSHLNVASAFRLVWHGIVNKTQLDLNMATSHRITA